MVAIIHKNVSKIKVEKEKNVNFKQGMVKLQVEYTGWAGDCVEVSFDNQTVEEETEGWKEISSMFTCAKMNVIWNQG